MRFIVFVGAGFRDCLFVAQMVGEPAPTISKNMTDTEPVRGDRQSRNSNSDRLILL